MFKSKGKRDLPQNYLCPLEQKRKNRIYMCKTILPAMHIHMIIYSFYAHVQQIKADDKIYTQRQRQGQKHICKDTLYPII